MEILSILTGAFVAGCDLGIKKYTEENVRDGEERRIWKGKGIYRKVHNKGLMMNHLDCRPDVYKRQVLFLYNANTFFEDRMLAGVLDEN